MAEIIPLRRREGFTQDEHDALTLLAAKLSSSIEFGVADDGAPWAAFETTLGAKFSVVREHGRVTVLDEQAQRIAEASTVSQVVRHLWEQGA